MRFRLRKTVSYLLIGLCILVVLMNYVGYKKDLDPEGSIHPLHDGLFGPRNPKAILFNDRFKKYETSGPPFSFPPTPVVRDATSLVSSLVNKTSSSTSQSVKIPADVSNVDVEEIETNGSENEIIRMKVFRSIQPKKRMWNVAAWIGKTDPKRGFWDDRILEQISHVPHSYKTKIYRKSKDDDGATLKMIYVPAGLDQSTPYGRDKFLMEECPVSACNLTNDPAFERTAELRLLQQDVYFEESEEKPPNQIWAIWILESPMNTMEFTNSLNLINWTATFRWDSTIVTPYAKFVPFPASNVHSPAANRNYAAGKTKMAAWFVSNCAARNTRLEYVQELARFIPVDIFGSCGTLECPRSSQSDCNEMLNRDYKFYLSFENTNCDYYITEKYFETGLGNDVLPIVMGARKSDYERASPPNSFLHVDDFSSVEELAGYLLKLNGSDALYNEYFKWKNTGEFINTKFWCRLCALLHDDHKPSMWYTNFQEWWSHPGTCRRERWGRVVGGNDGVE